MRRTIRRIPEARTQDTAIERKLTDIAIELSGAEDVVVGCGDPNEFKLTHQEQNLYAGIALSRFITKSNSPTILINQDYCDELHFFENQYENYDEYGHYYKDAFLVAAHEIGHVYYEYTNLFITSQENIAVCFEIENLSKVAEKFGHPPISLQESVEISSVFHGPSPVTYQCGEN